MLIICWCQKKSHIMSGGRIATMLYFIKLMVLITCIFEMLRKVNSGVSKLMGKKVTNFIHKQCRSKQKQKLTIALDLMSFFLILVQFHSLLLAHYYLQQINYILINIFLLKDQNKEVNNTEKNNFRSNYRYSYTSIRFAPDNLSWINIFSASTLFTFLVYKWFDLRMMRGRNKIMEPKPLVM